MDSRNRLAGEDIELDEALHDLTSDRHVTQALAPTDSGKDAYMVLAGCFLAEVFTWGTAAILNFETNTANHVQ